MGLSITKVYAATKDFIKVLRFGKDDIRTVDQYLPHGFDSKPLPNTDALYGSTQDRGGMAIIGYLLRSDKTLPGESRMYVVDDNGDEVFYIHQKKDGSCEIGGSDHNLVRYAPLNQGLQDFNAQTQAELAKISLAIAALSGTYTPGTLSMNISASKIDELKTL